MGYFIDESLSDSEFTAPLNVPGTFGYSRVIESITIHHWGVFGQTHDGVLDWFVNRNPNTSAHFVVSDGRINCLVSPANAAWAAGNAYGNARSIHIECRPEATDGDYATVAWLVSWLRANYGADLPLVRHGDWTSTACPGVWDLARLDALARGTVTPAASAATPIPEEDILATLDDVRLALREELGLAVLDGQANVRNMGALFPLVTDVRAIRDTLTPGESGVRHAGAIAGMLAAIAARPEGAPVDVDAIADAVKAAVSEADAAAIADRLRIVPA